MTIPIISIKRFILHEIVPVPMFSGEHSKLKFEIETRHHLILSTSIKDELGLVDVDFLAHFNHKLHEKIMGPNLFTFKLRTPICEENITLNDSVQNCSLKLVTYSAATKIVFIGFLCQDRSLNPC